MDYQSFIKEITDFIFVDDEPQKADIIFVPGNRYPQMAEKAADLYKKGYAPFILPSGHFSIVKGKFEGPLYRQDIYNKKYETEWDYLKDVLMKNGVPEKAILKEDQATYTYQNALLSKEVCETEGLKIRTAILCCKATHARRAMMYYKTVFTDTKIFVCPSVTDDITAKNWMNTEAGISEVTGEVSRVIYQFQLQM